MAITGYLSVVYLKRRYLNSEINTMYIEISGILNGFRLVF
jgi:hypothetical protein